MKSSNKIIKFTIFVLLLTIITISLVSGTFARYTTTISGGDTAVVAKWDVSAGIASDTVKIFDESAIYDTKNADYAAGVVDADVNKGNTSAIIAPGTWGKFSYEMSKKSEVNAEYSVDYTIDEAGVPLQWSTDGSNWTDTLENITGVITDDMTVDIYWKWAFESNNVIGTQSDTSDTALGEAATLAEPEITITATFTQID